MAAVRNCWLGVRSIEAALAIFENTMQLRRERAGEVSSDRMALWGLAGQRARYVELSGAGYPVGRLRLVEFNKPVLGPVREDHGPSAPDGPLDIGPKAIDFYVPAPIEDAVQMLRAAGLEPRTAPKLHTMGPSRSAELLFSGLEGTPILAMVGYDHKPTSQRPGSPDGPFSEIATISIIADEVDRSRRFYEDGLGMTAVVDTRIPDEFNAIVCDLVDAPPGTPIHVMSYAEPGEASGKLLLVHFLVPGRRRLAGRMRPGALGLNLFTMRAADLDATAERLSACGGTVMAGPAALGDDPDGHGLIMCGPNEECIELVTG